MPEAYDVAVIGAGVVGSAVARALAAYELRTVLLEAAADVGTGTSKANTAILHTGFDAVPASLEARLVARGYALMGPYAEAAGIPVERTGAVLVAWAAEEVEQLPRLEERAHANGSPDVRRVPADEVYALEPSLGPGARGGLLVPREAILCPFTATLALATEAVSNGVTLLLRSRVTGVSRSPAGYRLECGGEAVHARCVVNAAGLHADTVDGLFGRPRFTVRPRRGELIVYDKLARELVTRVILPVPTKSTKGVLVAPTVFGNLLLGPTAVDLDDKDDRGTTREGLASLLGRGQRILPALAAEEITATYAGLRAATDSGDYQVHFDADDRYLCLGGIRSTGVSASLALAEHAVERLSTVVALVVKRSYRPIRMPAIGEAMTRPFQDGARIRGDAEYGRLVCHCERVTAGEIRDALAAAIPARTLDGLRRRTRCLQGRCQGFYCLGRITAMLAAATGQPAAAVTAAFA
jgi:glycerol-3-phosphate dehydrogenase